MAKIYVRNLHTNSADLRYNKTIIRQQLSIMASFAKLGLNKTLQSNTKTLGYSKPTYIQEKAIGAVLSGTDTYAIAPTGTGKTAAYLLPILQELSQVDYSEEQVRPIRALFLVPTRELALQVEESIGLYGKGLGLRTISIFGGVRMQSQANRFKRGTDILVATPKRLMDMLKAKTISLEKIQFFVMDEADRLVSMGIHSELKHMMALMPSKAQKVLFSATDSKALNKFSKEYQNRVKLIKGGDIQPALDQIVHTMYRVRREEKHEHLYALLKRLDSTRVLIFAHSKHEVNYLNKLLNEQGFVTTGIHNDISQKKRQQRLEGFKTGEFNYLVATDIVSRGIDIDDLYYVVNFDLPVNNNDYLHRVGRTARTKTNKLATKKAMATKEMQQTLSKQIVDENKSNFSSAPEEQNVINRNDINGHVFSLVGPDQERLVPLIIKAVGKDIKLERPTWRLER
ncbi:DEAD/DEAH box helicase [Psychrosphaera aestuarii]|uniref:DEAD/DEAH box helicase n=1 Tax=Psychrosphaera aestuarii TaxID=1266052 RepID=UPI001FD4B735|nr:DEAD/DEAH box helicase [Psychrosphaera aestuarii]